MKIGFCSLDWSNLRDEQGVPTPGGACYARMALPAEQLAAHGIDALIGPNLGMLESGEFVLQTWDGEMHEGLDVVVLQRWMDASAPDLIKRARSTGQVVINDVDDWYDGLDTTNAAWKGSHPKANPQVNRDHYRRVLASSSALTVSTPYLAERLKRLGTPVHLVRNMIDASRWQQQSPVAEVVGWVGATAYRSRDLETLRGTLGPWLKRLHWKFFHGGHAPGSTPAYELLGLDLRITKSANMTSIHEYPKLFSNFGIGIVPLSAQPFNFAKSAIKGLEYAAAGIPFIASATPEYERLAKEGIGFVASKPRDWLRMLDGLADRDCRREAGATARRLVCERYDVGGRWQDWLTAYEAIAAACSGSRQPVRL